LLANKFGTLTATNCELSHLLYCSKCRIPCTVGRRQRFWAFQNSSSLLW